ncbi:MAG TPA: class 1 fructose-bisphosphatase [Candidatus Krumholzibacterium sp.]|nr:class 1 fructose-bisphosphatase [Candidatus Krumholzibacterium sp.]
MMKLEQSFMDFMLHHQERHQRSYNFLVLLEAVQTAAKYIQYFYQTGSLKNMMGEAGAVNVQGENVMKMDDIADSIVMHYLARSNQVICAVTEEEADPVTLNEDGGRYYFYYDPLDGSSNIRHNLPVGFMFAVGKRNLDGPEDHHLRKGSELRAAGIFLIPTGVFTLALADTGVFRFHQDETMTYVIPDNYEKLVIPDNPRSWELSFNAANRSTFSTEVREWIDENESRYAFRYMGSLAGDFHRLLSNGGMFMYPAIVNHPDRMKNRPNGKLRLLYEANVAALMAREAGGIAIDQNGDDILDIVPETPHQRTALFVGSRPLVEDIRARLKKGS